jgi:hypothetical protein
MSPAPTRMFQPGSNQRRTTPRPGDEEKRESRPVILGVVIRPVRVRRLGLMALGLSLAAVAALTGCHQGEQAVVGAARKAVSAEQQARAAAQAKATSRERQRVALAHVPLPTKSLYVNVHDRSAWANPFLSVAADTIDLRITLADANPSEVGQGTMLRPEAARRQEIHVRPEDLADALVALPEGAWRYGRVIAIAEVSETGAKDRPKMRRNLEAAIQQMTDLGIVVEEWPTR